MTKNLMGALCKVILPMFMSHSESCDWIHYFTKSTVKTMYEHFARLVIRRLLYAEENIYCSESSITQYLFSMCNCDLYGFQLSALMVIHDKLRGTTMIRTSSTNPQMTINLT